MKTSPIAAAALAALAPRQESCDVSILTPDYEIPAVRAGWQAQLVMNGLVKPRTIEVDSEGALLILDAGAGVRHVTFNDHGSTCLEVDQNRLIVDNDKLNHGMALSLDGKTLYASDVENVYAWAYNPATGSIDGEPKVVVTNMTSNQHVTRTLLVSEHNPGYLVISRGSNENLAALSQHMDSGMSQIRAFNVNSTDSYPIQFLDGVVLGWGLRNSVGVAEDPVTGNIYSVENSVDDVERDGQLIKEDNPGEELNLHGTIENASDSSPRNYGYPMCFAVWDADDIPNHDGLQVGDQFASDINSTLTDDICNTEYHKPRLAFPAHYAPLDARFNKDGDELFVSFHGSFNREDPHGYKLSTVEFNNGEPVKPRNSTDSLTDIVYMRSTDACPDNCFRPVGLAWDSKDRLFVTSDSTGEVFIIERQSGTPTSDEAGTFVQPAQSGSTDGDSGSAASGVVVQTMGVVAAALCAAMLLSF